MESKPSTSTATSTTAKQDPMPLQQNTAPDKKKSNAKPASFTPNPAPTSVVQKYMTDVAAIISANKIAKWEKETGKNISRDHKMIFISF